MRYYLARDYKFKHLNDAGSKARMDIEHIMNEMGLCSIGRHHGVSKSRLSHFVITLMNVARMIVKVKKDDILVLQYPTKYYSTICRIAHKKGAQVISFIHDLDCFRLKRRLPKEEISLMNQSDALIGCNTNVCRWLLNNGFTGYSNKAITVPMHLFDFLSEAQNKERGKTGLTHKIVYAGQLAPKKNKFLYSFGRYIHNFDVNVYGKGFDKQYAENPTRFNLKGFLIPDELIREAEGDFGLVWDGDSVDCCQGDWGEYLALNTPHKTSLYIRCGLPIIIWKQAAMAEFVRSQNIGICVDSLRDINHIYERLTPEEYNCMCENVKRVCLEISEGHYFRKAITDTIARL